MKDILSENERDLYSRVTDTGNAIDERVQSATAATARAYQADCVPGHVARPGSRRLSVSTGQHDLWAIADFAYLEGILHNL